MDGSPISQVQFNTQVPSVPFPVPRFPLANVTNERTYPDRPGKAHPIRSAADDSLLRQIREQKSGIRKPTRPIKTPAPADPTLEQADSESSTAASNELAANNRKHQSAEGPNKTATTATLLADNIVDSHRSEDESAPRVGIKEPASMPVNLQDNFRKWRTEALAGRYIRRRACKIPKDQLTLLESEDCWQPAAPGKDTRPATVPIALLDRLTAEADERATALNTEAFNAKEAENTSSPGQIQRQKLYSRFEELDSSEVLSASQWSPSPSRQRQAGQLPADSSPLKESVYPITEPTLHNGSPHPGQEAQSDHTSQDSSDEGMGGAVPDPSLDDQRRQPASSTSVRKDNSNAQAGRSRCSVQIHVEQTPFMDRESVTKNFFPGSSYVPSTYAQTGHLVSLKPAADMAKLPPVPKLLKDQSHSALVESSKRKVSANDDARPIKRPKPDVQPGLTSPSMSDITSSKLEYRRTILKPISKTPRQNQVQEVVSDTRSAIRDETSNATKDEDYERSHGRTSASTPLTEPSAASHTVFKRPTSMAPVGSSPTRLSLLVDIYDDFKSAYPSYTGTKRQFDEACTYLKKRRNAKEGPHPSHFDDYVFHHHQTYQPYKMRMIEEGDDPVPYRVYFNDHVAVLDCHANIITPECLDIPSLSRSRSRLSNVEIASPATLPEVTIETNKDRSIGPNSSVSNAKPPPVVEAVVEPESCQQPDAVETTAPTDHLDDSQRSSVKTWIEQTARAASVELGTPEVDRSMEVDEVDISEVVKLTKTSESDQNVEMEEVAVDEAPEPTQDSKVKPLSSQRRKSRPSGSPFISAIKRKKEKWWKQPTGQTPFQQFFNSYSKLPEPDHGEADIVNPFSWRK